MKINQLVIVSLFSFIILIGHGCGGGACNITDLNVEVGDCTCIDGYALTLDFTVTDQDGEFFELFVRNNVSIGFFQISDLPITIDHFTMSGLSDDFLKIVFVDNPDCTAEIEFFPPDCSDACDISELSIDKGNCNPDGNYSLTIDFNIFNTSQTHFDLFIRNDELIGFFPLNDLPLTIENFEPSGNNYDFIKVCINDNPNCCEVIEFMPPECEGECRIFDLEVGIGECTSDDTYLLEINFLHENPGNDFFDLFIRNDELIGTYRIDELALVLEEFPRSGNDEDFIKICINDHPDCCLVTEFIPPTCNDECEISELSVLPIECTSDSTYTLTLDFVATNPGNDFFEIFIRNNVFVDFYLLSELPLTIENFGLSGSDYDFIKVCINDVEDCCQEIEFMPPDC